MSGRAAVPQCPAPLLVFLPPLLVFLLVFLPPLLVFIFPCTFVVLLFPVVSRFIQEGWLR